MQVASGYSTAIGVIVRAGMDINSRDLRATWQKNTREALLGQLFDRYRFDIEGGEDAMKIVKHKALCIMSKALNTW